MAIKYTLHRGFQTQGERNTFHTEIILVILFYLWTNINVNTLNFSQEHLLPKMFIHEEGATFIKIWLQGPGGKVVVICSVAVSLG